MPANDDIIALLRIAGVLLLLLVYLFFMVRSSDSVFIKKNLKKYIPMRNLEEVYKPYLARYFRFYNLLDNEGKLLFEKRVQRFIDLKQFVPRGLPEVTAEMKAAIAGTAIQLTFGYPDIYFRHFWRILVYPDSYYSGITHRYHMGEVDIRGLIALSWKGFREGFANPSDGRNLGYHEMAHALRLANIAEEKEYDFWDQDIMEEFDREAAKEAMKLRTSPGEPSIFKGYFLSDRYEFFSVSVECFFEKPAELKSYNQRLYFLLTSILKIDPLLMTDKSEAQSMAS